MLLGRQLSGDRLKPTNVCFWGGKLTLVDWMPNGPNRRSVKHFFTSALQDPSSQLLLCLFNIGMAPPIKQPATRPITSGALSESSGATIDRTTADRKPSRAPISIMIV